MTRATGRFRNSGDIATGRTAVGVNAALLAAVLAAACAPAVAPGGGVRVLHDSLPAPGADTLAIALLEHELAPPLDTRGFTELSSRALTAGPVARVRELAPADTVPAPFLRISLIRPGADPRDLLDSAAAGGAGAPGAVGGAGAAAGAGAATVAGAGPPDVLVTRDPAVIAYARARAEFTAEPLAWDRVHVAIITDPARTRIAATPEFRASLARDAVRADARGAQPPYPWQQPPCDASQTPRPQTLPPAPARRIVYPRGDATARDLAERLVALDRTVTTAALDSGGFTAALAAGADAVYVLALPVTPDTASADAAPCAALPPRPAGSVIVPLVETRAHAIVRGGTPPVVIGPGLPLRYAPDTSASR